MCVFLFQTKSKHPHLHFIFQVIIIIIHSRRLLHYHIVNSNHFTLYIYIQINVAYIINK